jgi:predicted small secreted protein
MAQVRGNNIMVKTNGLVIVSLLIAPMILTACSDKDKATDDIKDSVLQQKSPSEQSSLDLDDLINTENEYNLQELMHQVAQARGYAEKEGFVWSTTEPLIEKGYAAAKAGNEDQAKAFFQEAKLQFKLSIIQARYAAQHWKLLIPKEG